jgi:dTDP-4-dehydrorhamnose reductase
LRALSTPMRPVVALGRGALDIEQLRSIESAIETYSPRLLVNAAAITDVDRCEREPDLAFRVNADAAGRLAAVATRAGISFVQVSTDFVFDGSKREPYVVTDEPSPASVYGRSKLAGERAVLQTSSEALIVRTAWLYGVGGKNFASRIFEYAARTGRIRAIVDMQGSPTYAPDLAGRILLLSEFGAGGVYHATATGSASWYDVAKLAMRLASWDDVVVEPTTVAALGLAAPRPAYSVLRCLLSERLGLPPMRPWEEQLADFVECCPKPELRQ